MKRRILVVDDEPEVRGLVAEFLAGAGHEILPASSAEEARTFVEDGKPPDLVVLDLLLPGVGGTVFAHWLGRTAPETKILFLTGHGAEDAEERGVPAVAANLLLKPFGAAEVVGKVEELLGGGGEGEAGGGVGPDGATR